MKWRAAVSGHFWYEKVSQVFVPATFQPPSKKEKVTVIIFATLELHYFRNENEKFPLS